MKSVLTRILTFTVLLIQLGGCAVNSPHDKASVSKSIADRTGHSIPETSPSGAGTIPTDVSIEDGITEDEAVAIALWNNSQFQADLSELGFARADLTDAGLLRNPILSLLFPIGPKQLEFTVTFPFEVLWQRPKRIAVAELDVERTAENLVQHGLILARDVMISHSEVAVAERRKELASENERVLQEIARISAARLRLGDISEMEEGALHVESLRAQESALRRRQEAETARARFTTLLGFGLEETQWKIVSNPVPDLPEESLSQLMAASFASRPDLRAAELAIETAGERVGWEKSRIFNFTAILDANGSGKEGFEMGPGIGGEIPIFNWNGGKIERAQVQVQQAGHLYLATKQQIALQVKEAHINYLAAKESLDLCRTQWVPAASQAANESESSYNAGEISYLEVLQSTRQLLEARIREVESEAELHRAIANLKYSTGFYRKGQAQ